MHVPCCKMSCALASWSQIWLLSFNTIKCVVIKIKQSLYTLKCAILREWLKQKDLGIIISDDLRSGKHGIDLVSFVLKWMTLYTSYVHCQEKQMTFGIPFRNGIGDIKIIFDYECLEESVLFSFQITGHVQCAQLLYC